MLDDLNGSQETKYELDSCDSLESSINSQIDHEPELPPGERLIAYMTRDRS
jgi:hypothetical protein